MKTHFLILLFFLSFPRFAHSHGIGADHFSNTTNQTGANLKAPSPPPEPDGELEAGPFKAQKDAESSSPRWHASLETGWTSREMHYGVSETGKGSACAASLSAGFGGFTASFWSGFGIGSEYAEHDFTAACRINAGPLFFLPGYNFRYQPGFDEGGHPHHAADEPGGHSHSHEGGAGHEHAEAAEAPEHSHEEAGGGGHIHQKFSNELFAIAGLDAIPHVTPSLSFIWNLNSKPGGFMECRIDGDIPIFREALRIQPYALLGLNFGYNTHDYYGWNNFQLGLRVVWKINRYLSTFGGINYSVALAALRRIEQGNEVWANCGISIGF